MIHLRCRPWHPRHSDHEWNSRSAVIDPRPEPGVLAILRHWALTNKAKAIALALTLDLAAIVGLALLIGSHLK